MQPITRLLCAITLCVGSTGALAAGSDAGTEARQQWHQAIQAGYQSLADNAQALTTAANSYCQSPTPDTRADLEQQWLEGFLAWQRVRFVDFGPVENNNLAWQFQFWPDPKNLIARKAGYLLGASDPITTDLIDQSGVAVQGFPMLEYLLFDQQINTGDRALPADRACELLTGVARHIEANSQQLNSDWQAFKAHYLETEQYQDTTIRAGMTALEILEERRLAQPMGLRGNTKRNAYIADAWRSGRSLMTVEATIEGLKDHFLPGLNHLLEASGEEALAGRIGKQFEEVQENFPDLHMPMATLLADDARFGALQGLYVDISQLTTLVNDQAAVALGVVRGFNSSDGD